MKLHDKAGKIEAHSYSQDISTCMYEQGDLQEHELGYNLTLGSKKLPKPIKVKEVV